MNFRSSLYEYFRGEVEELETMLNRDFSAWKAHRRSQLDVSLRAAIKHDFDLV